MPHSPNLRYTKEGRAVHLNSKGARKFDSARAKALHKAKGHSEADIIKKGYASHNPDRTNERDHS